MRFLRFDALNKPSARCGADAAACTRRRCLSVPQLPLAAQRRRRAAGHGGAVDQEAAEPGLGDVRGAQVRDRAGEGRRAGPASIPAPPPLTAAVAPGDRTSSTTMSCSTGSRTSRRPLTSATAAFDSTCEPAALSSAVPAPDAPPAARFGHLLQGGLFEGAGGRGEGTWAAAGAVLALAPSPAGPPTTTPSHARSAPRSMRQVSRCRGCRTATPRFSAI